jgi:hypothetical protein
MLAECLRKLVPTGFDNLCIRFDRALDPGVLEEAVATMRVDPPRAAPVAELDRVLDELKFSTCVPRRLAEDMLTVRLSDPDAVVKTLAKPLRIVRM